MKFITAELELVLFGDTDILTTSAEGDNGIANTNPSGGSDEIEYDPFI